MEQKKFLMWALATPKIYFSNIMTGRSVGGANVDYIIFLVHPCDSSSQIYRYHSFLSVPIPRSIVNSSNSSVTGSGSSTDGSGGGSSSMIIHYVYSCLSAPRVSSKVCSCIMEMTVNLLSSSGWDGPGNEDREYALVGNTAKALESTEDSTWVGERGIGMEIGNDTNGPKLVLPLIPKLLSYMSGIVETESKRVKAGGNPRDLHLEFTVISK